MFAAVALAALTVAPAAVAMNPAQQTSISVSGAVPPLTVTLRQRLVTTSVNAAGTLVTVTASQATGNDVLHLVDAAGDSADVPIRVAFNAGTIPSQLTLTVTGNPLDPAWLSREIYDTVARATQSLPGTVTTIATPSPPPLRPGTSETLAVPVQIAGNGAYFDQSASTSVVVNDVDVPAPHPEWLFYDDDPEEVGANGVIYRGTVTSAHAVRLYTYHESVDASRTIAVVLQSPVATQVQLIDAPAGPNVDVMSVGHAVGVEYLTQEPIDEGAIVTLAADTPFVLHDPDVDEGQLVAEVLDLRVLSGGPVTLTVLSANGSPLAELDAPQLPGDGHHRTGVFDLAGFGDLSAHYVAGGPDASVTYGGRDPSPPPAEPSSRGTDYGNYGVLEHIAFTLTNPTGAPATAYLYERPSGSPVRSSFLVDGSLIQLGCAREALPYQVQAYALAPGATYQVTIETMTDGGSAYPIEVGITGTPPAPATPAIDAPDGCFPRVSRF